MRININKKISGYGALVLDSNNKVLQSSLNGSQTYGTKIYVESDEYENWFRGLERDNIAVFFVPAKSELSNKPSRAYSDHSFEYVKDEEKIAQVIAFIKQHYSITEN